MLPLPEIIETYPGGRLDFPVRTSKPKRPVLHSKNFNNKVNMIAKSDDHLIVDGAMSTKNAKSTGNLSKLLPSLANGIYRLIIENSMEDIGQRKEPKSHLQN